MLVRSPRVPARRSPARRGAAAVWVIAAVPALTALLVLVADVACLWQARLQLDTAAAAGALAGAQVWADSQREAADRLPAAQAARTFTQVNRVLKTPVAAEAIEVQVGNLAGTVFQSQALEDDVSIPACRVRATAQVTSLWPALAGPYTIHAAATAAHEQTTHLVRIESIE